MEFAVHWPPWVNVCTPGWILADDAGAQAEAGAATASASTAHVTAAPNAFIPSTMPGPAGSKRLLRRNPAQQLLGHRHRPGPGVVLDVLGHVAHRVVVGDALDLVGRAQRGGGVARPAGDPRVGAGPGAHVAPQVDPRLFGRLGHEVAEAGVGVVLH